MSWKGSQGSWGQQSSKGQQNWSSGATQQQWGNSNQSQQWGNSNAGKGKSAAVAAYKQQAAQVVPASSSPSAQKAAGKGGKPAGGKGGKGGWSDGWSSNSSWGQPDKGPEFIAKAAKHKKEAEATESLLTNTLNSSKVVLDSATPTLPQIKASVDTLEKQQTKLNELQKALTVDAAEARKAGASAAPAAKDLSQLLDKVRGLWQNATKTVNMLKAKQQKMQTEAEVKAKEAKDTAAFKPVLAKATADAATAEKLAQEVVKKADPLIVTPMEDGEEKDSKIAAIEAAAVETVKKIEASRNELNEKSKSIVAYAPQAKAAASSALMELSKKINDALKAVAVFKFLKKELPKLIENNKGIAEATEKMAGLEAEITKADGIAKGGSIDKSKVEEIDGLLTPVKEAVKAATVILVKFGNQVDAATRDKANKLRARGDELNKKCNAVTTKIKGPRDVVRSEEAIDAAKEKLEASEASWSGCQDAEMPFLMGVEMLPTEDNDKALKKCQEAAENAGKTINLAKTYVRERLNESKGYEKELGKKTADALNPIMKKLEEVQAKFSKFSKDLVERKMMPVLAEAVDATKDLESKVKAAASSATALTGSDLEEQSSEQISAAIEKCKTAQTEANQNLNSIKTVLKTKQREARAPETHPSIVSVNKLINGAQEKLRTVQVSLDKAQQLVKMKSILAEATGKVKEAEEAAQKAKKLVPAEGKPFTVETVASLDDACAAASKLVNAVIGQIGGKAMQSAPPKAKAETQKLLEANKAAQAILDEVKTSTRDRREAALAEKIVEEAEVKMKAAEEAGKKADEIEQPFLTGTALGLQATQELLKKCNEAAADMQKALSAVTSFTNQKTNEVKQFRDEAKKKVKDGFAPFADRVKAVTVKHTKMDKDNKERAQEAKMTEAGEKVDEYEAGCKKTVSAGEPFTKEGADTMSEADAEKPLNEFLEVEKDTFSKQKAINNLLQNLMQTHKSNKARMEVVKSLQDRVKKAQDSLADVKKATEPHSKRALAKRLLAEAKEQVAGLEGAIKKATDACAPLLEQGGEQFLIGNSVQTLAAALQAHMKEKEVSEDDVFKSIAKGKDASEKAFVKYLSELPEAIKHDELNAFSDERRQAIFKRLASNGKGVSRSDFASLFRKTYFCAKAVTITDKLEVEGSETVCKVEKGEQVELFGVMKEVSAGLMRSECKMGDKTGWITFSQGKGKEGTFLKLSNAYRKFTSDMDWEVNAAGKTISGVGNSIKNKLNQLSQGGKEANAEAKKEMAPLQEEVAKALKVVDDLRRKVTGAKKAFEAKEVSERNAHIEARNQKEAAPYIDGPKAKMEPLEADAKAAEEAAAPMISLNAEDLKAFATPASVIAAVEKLNGDVKSKADALREVIKEQLKAATEASPQTGGTAEAKKQLKSMSGKLENLVRSTLAKVNNLKSKAKSLVSAKLEPVAEAIRKSAQAKGSSIEDYFAALAKDDKIPEAAFCKMLCALELDGGSLSPEIAKLLSRTLEADGVSKQAFMTYVVVYYKVMRSIAYTDTQDINTCKTVRKADEGEVIEVLEGPIKDESNGMIRIRGKSFKEPHTVGWVTVSGSSGTPFLQKTTRPKEPSAPKEA